MIKFGLIIALTILGNDFKFLNQIQDHGPSAEMHPSWSPTGEFIVFYSDKKGNGDLFIINVRTGEYHQLTTDLADDENPVWSPTGEFIAFHSSRSGGYDIYIVRPDGTGLRQLTSEEYWEMSPTWAPDGKSLVYEADFEGNWQLFTLDIATTQKRQLTFGEFDHLASVYNSDGRYLYYGESSRGNHQTDVEIHRLDLNDKTDIELTNKSGVSSNATISSSSDRIIFNTFRDGDWEIYSMDLEGGNAKRLTFNSKKLPDFEYSDIDGQPSLSFDGKKIAFMSGRAGSFDICIMDISGENYQNLTKDYFLEK